VGHIPAAKTALRVTLAIMDGEHVREQVVTTAVNVCQTTSVTKRITELAAPLVAVRMAKDASPMLR